MPNGGIFPASPTNRSFVIGQTGGFAPFHEPFKGQIDEFDIVSRALTPLEVKAIHLAGPYGKCKTDEDVVAVTPVPDGCPTHIEDKNKNDIFEPNGPDGNPLTLGDNETDWLDPDTDNDGRYDCAAPGSEDQNNNGIFEPAGFDEDLCTDDDETNPLIADTDGDGLTDGYELGMTAPENPLFSAENFVPDDDPSTTSCPNKADTDDDGVGDATDLCPTTSGLTLTGCPFADKQTVDLHIIDQAKRGDCNGAGSCKKRIAGSEVRIFDRNKLNGFSITLLSGGSATLTKNPSGDLYDDIFESANAQTTARVGKCTTDFFGTCTAGEETKGDFLVIVKSKDTETNTLVYTGLPKGLSDFVDTNGDGDGDLATKEFQVIKVIRKDGGIEFKGGVKRVVAGSILEIVYPESTVWEGVKQVYPFIFTSDSSWTVDVCLEIPTGYSIVGIYDENGNLLSTTQCQQTFVTGQTKIVAFEVNELSSPPPHMKAKLKLKGPKGNVQTFDLDIPGKRVEKAVAPKEGGFIRFLKNLLQGLGF
ncbi:MAG: hypothetical protein A3C90_02530 [Candidatus Magasanikbacteria bacterium RIFCSPHIGHO2_02_FULL_51_14]|uniref:Uncharacterized protein n=1 Tax=Candidatus Magasanikbacteria bacterium RIFCSPHIGHO2_02_FULL_51_14 TaxID=1798683 RepID=A0A1F6MD53_9BACT|nr:MAG: hypothetical protein A3C90_02530 [Candidatus Magasanikbacteria bacterium RIFCSPHIGHO2_02_FULL_51_14]